MWKRVISPLAGVVLLAVLVAPVLARATPITSRQAPSIIKKVLKARVDATGSWRARLGGKPGDRIRPFSAANTSRTKRVTGTINLRTGMVDIRSIVAPRGEP